MAIKKKASSLPGDLNKKEEIERMIRVNQAGEYGARRIYEGQLSVLKGHKEIQHMHEQELEHLEYFDKALVERKIRPTALSPIWHGAGFALGAITAMMGEKAAMACTVAVEEVIGEHYQEQVEKLEEYGDEPELTKSISKFRDEELEHRDTGLEHGAEQTTGYEPLYKTIQIASKAAIWLSKRI